MAQCSFHPGVETEVRCSECGRYICPKDMVETPVGYKCPICARPASSQLVHVKPAQLVKAIIAGLLVGILGGIVLAYLTMGFFGWFLGFVWGSLTAEATRRASGGHRVWTIGVIAIVAIVLGALAGFGITGRFQLIASIIAIVVALGDLALIGR